jgi:hypothetical protein
MERTTPVKVFLRAVSESGRLERPFFLAESFSMIQRGIQSPVGLLGE